MSTDIDGKPIVILTIEEAKCIHNLINGSCIHHSSTEQKIIAKIIKAEDE